MKHIVGIIQARMGSTRLPEKTLADINGKKLIDIVLTRVSQSKYINEVVVATTVNPKDDILTRHLKSENRNVFRGSEDNVLERFYTCGIQYKADYIVRITADDPFKDPEIIDMAVATILNDDSLDYCSNTLDPSFPEGLDIEVFKFSALKKAFDEATLKSEREHVTPYIWKNTNLFKVLNFRYTEDLKDWRWTIDKPEDLVFARTIFEHFEDFNTNFREIIDWLKTRSDIREINSGIIRNEGYLSSLQRE